MTAPAKPRSRSVLRWSLVAVLLVLGAGVLLGPVFMKANPRLLATARFANDSFGTHIKSYEYDPKPYVERVTRFFDAASARPEAGRGREG